MHYRPPRRPSSMSITIDGMRRAATITDVSESGLQLIVPDGLPIGTRVTLVAPRLEIGGEVRWCRADRAGLQLDRALTPGEQAELAGAW